MLENLCWGHTDLYKLHFHPQHYIHSGVINKEMAGTLTIKIDATIDVDVAGLVIKCLPSFIISTST